MFDGFKFDEKTVNGTQISYVSAGSGPAVLFLHGYPQTKAMWAKVAPELAQNFTVICADLRGYGDSEKPENTNDNLPYSFREMARDQKELMTSLGYNQFHIVGHDRGGRTAHRLALDNPDTVLSVTLMDIVPTLKLFEDTDRHSAGAYWHWFFLSQPAPFPENMINANPNCFYETCLLGWGATNPEDFDQEMLSAYRKAWHDPDYVRGSCNDYRAAASIDLVHDAADIGKTIDCPSFIMYGADGSMAKLFDVPETWADRCSNMQSLPVPGGHFFVDEHPEQVANSLAGFLKSCRQS